MQLPVVRLVRLFSVALAAGAALAACGSDAPGSSQWVGNSYRLEVPADNWVKPQGIGGDVGDFVPQFLLGVAKGTGSQLTVTVGTAKGGVQDTCNPTVDVGADGGAYPKSEIVVTAFPLHIVDTNQTPTVVVDTTIRNLTFTNVLPDGAARPDGTVDATIDAEEVYPLFRLIPNPSKDSVCQALASAGSSCVPCPHNNQPYCLTIGAVQVTAVTAASPVVTIAAGSTPATCSAN
jgi:hypothetical protein